MSEKGQWWEMTYAEAQAVGLGLAALAVKEALAKVGKVTVQEGAPAQVVRENTRKVKKTMRVVINVLSEQANERSD